MGSPDAKAYLASPEVVAASALRGYISGPGSFKALDGSTKVILGEGSGNLNEDKASSIQDALENIISQADLIVESAQSSLFGNRESHSVDTTSTLTEIVPGFPEKVTGEIVFCDADNMNTDAIYPGKYTYQDNVTLSRMAEVCMENYDQDFHNVIREGDILVSGFNFGCGSSREQAATAILANKVPLVVAGSFGNIFSRNSINNALLGLEVPKLVKRLREYFASQPREARMTGAATGNSLDSLTPAERGSPNAAKVLTRRTGWTFVWDVQKSRIEVQEGEGGVKWSQNVGQLPPNVQEIIARGGLEGWVRQEIGIA
jgi:homoaconitate hydratase